MHMGERHALLIATAHHVHPRLADRSEPYERTQRLAATLRESEFDSVRVLLDGRKANIEFEIERLYRDRHPDDLVLLSLSGHGFVDDGQAFYAAADSDPDSPYATATADFLIARMLDRSRAGRRPVLLDCSIPLALGRDAEVITGDDLHRQLGTAATAALPAPARVIDHRLRAQIGVDPQGRPVELDLKEPAQGGDGPHALLIGDTGSGKSELLRTLVLGLARTNPSDTLNFLLVDFCGGNAFDGFGELPHVSAVISDLLSRQHLCKRLYDVLDGELARRQEVLNRAGAMDFQQYERRRAEGEDLPPLPRLLVIVEEFSVLLSAAPELMDVFMAIGRIGRRSGVHMLLAGQRIEEARLRGLNSMLPCRIALRTYSSAESQAVLGVPDAYDLPPQPGAGYLRTATGEHIRFDTTLADWEQPAGGMSAYRMWQPELPAVIPLGAVQGLGLTDRPYEHRQVPLTVEPGPVAIVGRAGSGKTTLLGTLILSLAGDNSPAALHFYLVDCAGGGLTGLEELPHVVASGGSQSADRVRRILGDLTMLLHARAQQGPAEYGQVYLIIDGWGTFRSEFEDHAAELQALITDGPAVDIHVVLTATRWPEIRPVLKDLIRTKLELHLADPAESDIDRRLALTVPGDLPGRGITLDKLHFQAALPGDLDEAIERLKALWPGVRGPRFKPVPDVVSLADLPAGRNPKDIPLGLEEQFLAPVHGDFTAEPHLLVFGASGSGKTTLMRTILSGITDRYTPAEALIMIVDFRRDLLGLLGEDYLLGHASSATALTGLIDDVFASMWQRRQTQWTGPDLFLIVDCYELVATQQDNPLTPLAEFLPQASELGLHLILARDAHGASRALYDPVIGTLREMATPGLVLAGPREEGALLGATAPDPDLPPGRGTLVRRGMSPVRIQVAQ
ncbi:type VII secretion protein EccCb [Pseudonocardiaceae bacterium YIM PH 21723]|nr:type VII secretion protein EccCb [Pseudonocardiaceae bacterium YIM PH 21723]